MGNPITIYGDGSQTRAFCYVDDLIAGCMKFMEDTGLIKPARSTSEIRASSPSWNWQIP